MEEKQISNDSNEIELCDSDNLNLTNLNANTIPPGLIFPNELNQYLQGQVQFLLHTKGMLERRISEQEDTLKENVKLIAKQNSKIAEYEQFTKPDSVISGNPVHLMSSKIVELSKKLKDKTVENESLKTCFNKMEQKLKILEKNKKKHNKNEDEISIEKEMMLNRAEDIKALQEKISQATNKLFEVKNKNIELRNEIKSANRILQQELGDSFTSIQSFSTSQVNWRGRAQQIIHLQQKNSELQDKLAILSLNETLSALPPKPDGRKQMIDQLEKEINNYKTEMEDLKRKLSAAKCRIRGLENECGTMKLKINTHSLKSENDENEMKQLQCKIHMIQEHNVEIDKEKQRQIKKLDEEIQSLKSEVERDNFVIESLKKNLEEKNIKIKELSTDNKKRISSSSSNESRISSPSAKIEGNKVQILEVERKRLLELVDVLNGRLKDERDSHSTTHINFKKERQKAAKLETKLSRLELENSLNSSSFSHTYSKSSKISAPNSNNDRTTPCLVTYENLKNSLELAEENASLLKSKLDLVQKEKDADLQKFSQIISESSSMFLKYNSLDSADQSTTINIS